LIEAIIPDPVKPDRVYILRGYDYGNISVSDDAGGTFTILCGDNNVSKTVNDVFCAESATWTMNFVTSKMYFKHHFQTQGVGMNLDASSPSVYAFSGLGTSASANLSVPFPYLLDTPVKGLPPRVGARSVRFTADGASILYTVGDPGVLWKAT